MQLSRSFEPFRQQILQSQTTVLYIQAKPRTKLPVHHSKFGGIPYLAQNDKRPTDEHSRPMQLLAQLNFEELPKLDNYPSQGILQFFISDNTTYGCDFNNPTQQKNFAVRYYPDLDLNSHQPSLGLQPFQNSPLNNQCYELSFLEQQEYVPSTNVEFKRFLGDSVECFFENNFGDKMYDTWDEYDQAIPQQRGHKIGGYANFTQNDPRLGRFENYILLLQIDSQDGIVWGDAGTANFFIHPQDLANLDFAKVLYHWDCY